MQSININNLKLNKRSQKLSEIIQLGFQLQNEFLMENGFLRLAQNTKVLIKTNGDQEKALEILSMKKQKKVNKIKSQISQLTETFEEIENKEIKSTEINQISTKCSIEQFYENKKNQKKKYNKYIKENTNFINNKEKLAKIIDTNINKIILDGNNMLFVHQPIRKLCIKGQRQVAEEMLVKITSDYTNGLKYIKSLLVVFDETQNTYETKHSSLENNLNSLNLDDSHEYNKINDLNLKVISARPSYSTSDDLLVDICDSEDKTNTLYVTSDRELQERLLSKGVKNVMLSGVWFKHVLSINNEIDNLDNIK